VITARGLGRTVLGLCAVFAIFGGEYSTRDWLTLRRQEREEAEQVARLTLEVDSLRAFLKAVKTDRRLQERIAREEFGMIRSGEYLFRIEPDSLDGE
jgi:cell division protein FtsB